MSETSHIRRNGASMDHALGALREWVLRNRAAERVLVTPARPKALIRRAGRSPGLMVPWLYALSRAKYPVSFATLAGGA